MVNYYSVLKVNQDATTSEIKSAYRKLARKVHPDLNGGEKETSREFARIVKAYKVLSDPQERAYYDKKRLKANFSKESVLFDLENPHASRAKQIMYEKRYNNIIDRMIAEERKESLALQQIIFPIVSLFISTGFVAVFKPLFWSNSLILGKIVMLTLFIIGLLHLMKRLNAGIERYTYSSINIHDSFLVDIDEETRPYSKLQAILFLIFGTIFSLLIGMLISQFLGMMTTTRGQSLFSNSFYLEFFIYPPIVVLFVDIMHSFASRLDKST
jgi:hypothetical protein